MTKPTFEQFKTEGNKSLEYARDFLSWLWKFLIERKWVLWQPVIIGIQGAPWVWKTHLIKALKDQLNWAWIHFFDSSEKQFLLSVTQEFKGKENFIVIADDILQRFSNLNQCPKQEFVWLGEAIYELYERNWVLIVTSNFDIREIFAKVAATDDIWRLKSRCNQLLGSIQPIHIEAPDYREKLAKTTGGIWDLVNNIMRDRSWNMADKDNKNELNSDIERLIQSEKDKFFSIADNYLRKWWMSIELKWLLARIYFENKISCSKDDITWTEFEKRRKWLLKKYHLKWDTQYLQILNKAGEVCEKWSKE